jgi:hypothetical protein
MAGIQCETLNLRILRSTGLPPPWGPPSTKQTPHIPFGWGGGV